MGTVGSRSEGPRARTEATYCVGGWIYRIVGGPIPRITRASVALVVRTPWRTRAPSPTSHVAMNSAFLAYSCGMQEGDRRGSNPRPSEPQVDGRDLRGGRSGALAGQRMPRRGRIAVRLQYGPRGDRVEARPDPSLLPSGGPAQVGTTPKLAFRALIEMDEAVEMGVAL